MTKNLEVDLTNIHDHKKMNLNNLTLPLISNISNRSTSPTLQFLTGYLQTERLWSCQPYVCFDFNASTWICQNKCWNKRPAEPKLAYNVKLSLIRVTMRCPKMPTGKASSNRVLTGLSDTISPTPSQSEFGGLCFATFQNQQFNKYTHFTPVGQVCGSQNGVKFGISLLKSCFHSHVCILLMFLTKL